jgi:hypothetical protein
MDIRDRRLCLMDKQVSESLCGRIKVDAAVTMILWLRSRPSAVFSTATQRRRISREGQASVNAAAQNG